MSFQIWIWSKSETVQTELFKLSLHTSFNSWTENDHSGPNATTGLCACTFPLSYFTSPAATDLSLFITKKAEIEPQLFSTEDKFKSDIFSYVIKLGAYVAFS